MISITDVEIDLELLKDAPREDIWKAYRLSRGVPDLVSARLRDHEAAHSRCTLVEFGGKLAIDQAKVGQRRRVAKCEAMESRARFVLMEYVVNLVAELAR